MRPSEWTVTGGLGGLPPLPPVPPTAGRGRSPGAAAPALGRTGPASRRQTQTWAADSEGGATASAAALAATLDEHIRRFEARASPQAP
jgi:hypothetical protein